jgi:hypothetical protein
MVKYLHPFKSKDSILNIVCVHTKKVIRLMYIYAQCHGPFWKCSCVTMEENDNFKGNNLDNFS